MDVFFNTSLASVKRPVKKALVAKKTVPDSVEVTEVAATGTEIIAIDQAGLGEGEADRGASDLAERVIERVSSAETRVLASLDIEGHASEPREGGADPGASVSEEEEASAEADEQFARELGTRKKSFVVCKLGLLGMMRGLKACLMKLLLKTK